MCAIMEDQHLGIDLFILSGRLLLGGFGRVAELLFPKLLINPVTTELGSARVAGGS